MRITPGQGLALARIAFGLYFLSQALDKLNGNWLSDGGPLARFTQQLLPRSEAFYRPFLESTVVPESLTFARLVTTGELVVAILLILGLFTRLGAVIGLWLNLNYMFMKGLANNAGSIDRLFVAAELAFALAAAGLVWGLDGYLARSLPRARVVRWLAGPQRREPVALTS
ncbi:MAG: DoxX family membrane protein [Chloroflexota bacterium]|nr:DoxX family membrane protein [Chloroflexota bacterium]